MTDARVITQIVPRSPGGRDGVGDYALRLGEWLRKNHGVGTIFAVAQAETGKTADLPAVVGPLRQVAKEIRQNKAEAVILHYVNYAYDRRGIPLWLPDVLTELKGTRRLLTIFHELYAIGSLRQSAFWLRPLQKRCARRVAQVSDAALVSSGIHCKELERLSPATPVCVRPVFSNLGEPELTAEEIDGRDPHCWVICGGSELVRRSIRSFAHVAEMIDPAARPRQLFVVGGSDQRDVVALLRQLKGTKTCYCPNVSAAEASKILGRSAFGWIDYFVQPVVPLPTILKSSVFAALCAHGIVPVFPRGGAAIKHEDRILPGPFFVSKSQQLLPPESERGRVAQTIYGWYRRNAFSAGLADLVWSQLLVEKLPRTS